MTSIERWTTHRGFTVIEVIAAGVMLATAMVITVQVLALGSAQARDAERRQLALQTAANIIERLTATPWETLDSDVAAAQTIGEEVLARLPGGVLETTIEPHAGPPRSKRILVTIRWRNRGGEFIAPVRLTAFAFPPEATND